MSKHPPSDLEALATRLAEICGALSAAACAFASRARIEAWRSGEGWCGDASRSAFVFLDHCAACWRDGALAGTATLLALVLVRKVILSTKGAYA